MLRTIPSLQEDEQGYVQYLSQRSHSVNHSQAGRNGNLQANDDANDCGGTQDESEDSRMALDKNQSGDP